MITPERCSDLSPQSASPVWRQRDRRRGLGEILAALSQAVIERGEGEPLRRVFETALHQIIPVTAVQLRDASAPWSTDRSRAPAGSVAFDVAGPTARSRAVLEARFEAGQRAGDWDIQLLHTAAHLAALVLEIDRSRQRSARDRGESAPKERLDGAAPLIGSTAIMAALRSRIERVAITDFTVLLEGESGVGKELVARQIHELSPRRAGPFVAINCAALVETLLEAELFGIEERTATGVRGRRGKFEHADGGTLFLDEVSDLSLSAQAKLLRAIQDLAVERVGGQGTRKVDIRIVAATNRGLGDLVKRNLFRADLFYRLGGVDIHVPSLRERRQDISELAEYFLTRHRATRRLRLSEAVRQALTVYDWPGNVRELERLIERAVALATSDVITLDDLPAAVRGDFAQILMPSLVRGDTIRLWGCRYARLVYERCQGNKRETARILGISSHTLNSYLRSVEERTDSEAPAAV